MATNPADLTLDVSNSPFCAAFALVLTPRDVTSGRAPALLMARGFDRRTIEMHIDAAERLVLEQAREADR